MPSELKEVLDVSVKVINFVKKSAKSSRIFTAMCEELESDYLGLLYYTEVRWLSRGKCLTRLFILRDEVVSFFYTLDNLTEEFINYYYLFEDTDFLVKLAYLADIFAILNELNLSMQGPDHNIFDIYFKIDGMKRRFKFYISSAQKSDFTMFPHLADYLFDLKYDKKKIKNLIIEHIKSLQEDFDSYFGEIVHKWIANPFIFDENNLPNELNGFQKDMLLDISANQNLKFQFENKDLFKFWVDLENTYPELSGIAQKKLISFGTTWISEQAFSMVFFLKNDLRNRLDLEQALRVKLSKRDFDFEKIVKDCQSHPSH